MRILILFLSCALAGGVLTGAASPRVVETDICIYGGTAAGVATAIQAARSGKSVVLLEPGFHLGGMTSGGLGATDIGNKAAVGGISREFYQRVARHYNQPDSWVWQAKERFFKDYGSRSTQADLGAPEATMWTFEPHVAEDILFQMLNDDAAPIYFQQVLKSVSKDGTRISEIQMENGRVYRAKVFIDTTYEGDLMAKAGVSFTVGREANALHEETLNGVRAETPKHQFIVPVDPYIEPGNSSSGLLPWIQETSAEKPGQGDASVQAYNYRLCFTRNAKNRRPNVIPANYDPKNYELLARYLEALVAAGKKPVLDEVWNPIHMPNQKTDINNNGGFSTDFIGQNYNYPNATPAERAKISRAHEDYIQGFIHFLSTSPRVPEHMRKEMQSWGPAADEFPDTDGWPHQMYVREARRMVGAYVMTEHNCRGAAKVKDPISLAAYGMDSHNCRRVAKDGRAKNEGDVQAGGFSPYPISYRAILPRAEECKNLAVPVCLSATHIAYGSIRMGPVFMILGQSAALAAVEAIERKTSLQKISYSRLHSRLLETRQILEWKKPPLKAPLSK